MTTTPALYMCPKCRTTCMIIEYNYCPQCGCKAHPSLRRVPGSVCAATAARTTKSFNPTVSLEASAWLKAGAARSSMTPSNYLSALVEEYEGGELGALPSPGGVTVVVHSGLPLDVHAWIKGYAADLGEPIASVGRWMINQEMEATP